ncbi:MarR family winged helix-turn-helix transcriptional regulator [Marinobacter sp. SS21]|uniref:MarR family winged helix-turn-helix transcriptional regulator n=1 Tax=Marinobacter sp. SS21 TaxID=2979460 RepID=UPI0023315950|nr:MarR family winged helix-turn-helix transcriptional regulator [Marinobacter sp. SS21]MDC0661391.1 MarR family winged helix-turn-helix transcriptional regulator [Marinobacter sp. SS21]
MNATPIYDLVERLGELLRVGARQSLNEFGLQPIQLEVLHYLSLCNRFSNTPMAVTEYLGQTKGTVSQTLKVLEKKALIEKVPDAGDKRVVHLEVTEQGRDLLAGVIPGPLFNAACSNLSADQQQQIQQSLQLLLTQLLKANGMKPFGQCQSCRHNRTDDDGQFYCGLVQQPLSERDVLLICKEHER